VADKNSEVWFSLGENHEKAYPLRSRPIAKLLTAGMEFTPATFKARGELTNFWR
jgi:hypothetical protein